METKKKNNRNNNQRTETYRHSVSIGKNKQLTTTKGTIKSITTTKQFTLLLKFLPLWLQLVLLLCCLHAVTILLLQKIYKANKNMLISVTFSIFLSLLTLLLRRLLHLLIYAKASSIKCVNIILHYMTMMRSVCEQNITYTSKNFQTIELNDN